MVVVVMWHAMTTLNTYMYYTFPCLVQKLRNRIAHHSALTASRSESHTATTHHPKLDSGSSYDSLDWSSNWEICCGMTGSWDGAVCLVSLGVCVDISPGCILTCRVPLVLIAGGPFLLRAFACSLGGSDEGGCAFMARAAP